MCILCAPALNRHVLSIVHASIRRALKNTSIVRGRKGFASRAALGCPSRQPVSAVSENGNRHCQSLCVSVCERTSQQQHAIIYFNIFDKRRNSDQILA